MCAISIVQVFEDYVKFIQKNGTGVRYLPTPAFYYGMDLGDANVSPYTPVESHRQTLFQEYGVADLALIPAVVRVQAQTFKLPASLASEVGSPPSVCSHVDIPYSPSSSPPCCTTSTVHHS